MVNSTKMRILDEALVSFATNGYKGTNLRDLATKLSLSKSALYKHFESKEAIWNAVIDMMEKYYGENFGSPENIPPIPKSCDELLTLTVNMLEFTLHDRRVVLTRRLLFTEQFRDERISRIATFHFLTATKDIFTKIFSEMMKSGLLKNGDPEMLAFAYTAPISALVQYCDREPQIETEIMEKIEAFVKHFISIYGRE